MDTPSGLLAVVFLAVLASHSGEATSDCYVKTVPASNALFLHRNDDVSIVCDASCFGRRNHGQVTWYGPGGNLVPRSRSGRMFQMIYNRNMFSRLFFFGIGEEDSGTYTCSVGEGADIKMASIFLDVSDGYIRQGEWGADSGRGRGDVSILVPTLPPLSPLRRRRAVTGKQTDDEDHNSSGDGSSIPPGTPETYSSSPRKGAGKDTKERVKTTRATTSSVTPSSTTNSPDPPSANHDGSADTTHNPSYTTHHPGAMTTPDPVQGTFSLQTTLSIDATKIMSSASTPILTTEHNTNAEKSSTNSTSAVTPSLYVPGSNQNQRKYSGDQPEKVKECDCSTPFPTAPATTPAYDLQHYFGSQGVIYFVVTLAIALLLAYTLILILYHQHCSRRQQATGSSEDKRREKQRKKVEKAEKKRTEKELREQKAKERQEAKEREKEAKEREKEAKEREKEAKKREKEAKQKRDPDSSSLQLVAMTDLADQYRDETEGAENKGDNNQDEVIDLDDSEAATKATADAPEAAAAAADAADPAEKGDTDEKDELAEAVMNLLATSGTTTAEVCQPPKEAGEEDGEKKDNKAGEASPGTVAEIPPAPPLPGDSGGQGSEEGKDGGGETDEQDKGSDEKAPDE